MWIAPPCECSDQRNSMPEKAATVNTQRTDRTVETAIRSRCGRVAPTRPMFLLQLKSVYSLVKHPTFPGKASHIPCPPPHRHFRGTSPSKSSCLHKPHNQTERIQTFLFVPDFPFAASMDRSPPTRRWHHIPHTRTKHRFSAAQESRRGNFSGLSVPCARTGCRRWMPCPAPARGRWLPAPVPGR